MALTHTQLVSYIHARTAANEELVGTIRCYPQFLSSSDLEKAFIKVRHAHVGGYVVRHAHVGGYVARRPQICPSEMELDKLPVTTHFVPVCSARHITHVLAPRDARALDIT